MIFREITAEHDCAILRPLGSLGFRNRQREVPECPTQASRDLISFRHGGLRYLHRYTVEAREVEMVGVCGGGIWGHNCTNK